MALFQIHAIKFSGFTCSVSDHWLTRDIIVSEKLALGALTKEAWSSTKHLIGTWVIFPSFETVSVHLIRLDIVIDLLNNFLQILLHRNSSNSGSTKEPSRVVCPPLVLHRDFVISGVGFVGALQQHELKSPSRLFRKGHIFPMLTVSLHV